MAPSSCPDLTAHGTMWDFCPNTGAAYFFCVLFALTLLTHIGQGIYYRKWYTMVICMSALWQFLAYVFRVLSIQHPASFGAYAGWFVLLLVAPVWTNAFVYMAFSRMVWNFTERARVFKVSAWRMSMIFVLLDLVAFVVQVVGAALASNSTQSKSQTLNYLHIYMAGVGIQQIFILTFSVFVFGLHQALKREGVLDATTKRNARTLLFALYACLLLITVRIIFRLIEYSSGLNSSIPRHEAFQYCFDSLPMLAALVLLNGFHPGRIMPGKETNIPSRKQRKQGQTTKFYYVPQSTFEEVEVYAKA